MKGLNVEAIMKSYGYFPKSKNNIDNMIYFAFILCSRGYNYTDCEKFKPRFNWTKCVWSGNNPLKKNLPQGLWLLPADIRTEMLGRLRYLWLVSN